MLNELNKQTKKKTRPATNGLLSVVHINEENENKQKIIVITKNLMINIHHFWLFENLSKHSMAHAERKFK